jgi:S1-C subfamily serine protease
MGVGLTVTQGIVSAKNRAIGIYGERGYENFIQTDASINPGNSGGALIDSEGRLVGINSAILSRSGGNIGIGFAIPSNLAMNISTQLVEGGEVRRGFLGVTMSDLTPELAEAFGVDSAKGALIQDVEKDSAADKGGIQPGDIVMSIDGKPVETANEFRIRVSNTVPGTGVTMGIIRDQKPMKIEVEVGEASGRFAGAANELLEGVEVSAIDDEQARKYRLPDNIAGVIITSVEPDSPFARYMSEGMVIVEINDQTVEDISQARDALRSGVNKVFFYNRGRAGYLAIRLP